LVFGVLHNVRSSDYHTRHRCPQNGYR
jgi:hypothetical protein